MCDPWYWWEANGWYLAKKESATKLSSVIVERAGDSKRKACVVGWIGNICLRQRRVWALLTTCTVQHNLLLTAVLVSSITLFQVFNKKKRNFSVENNTVATPVWCKHNKGCKMQCHTVLSLKSVDFLWGSGWSGCRLDTARAGRTELVLAGSSWVKIASCYFCSSKLETQQTVMQGLATLANTFIWITEQIWWSFIFFNEKFLFS